MPPLTRREWLAAGGIALASACGRKTGAGFRGYALIATVGEESITVADLADFRVVKQVPVSGSPQFIVAGGPGGRSYVLTPKTGSVHVLDREFNRENSRRIAAELSGLQLMPGGKRLVAIAAHSRELIEIDQTSLYVTRRWKLSAEPASMDVSDDGAVAISTGEHGIVELIEGRTGQQRHRRMSGPLGEVRFRADGKLLLAANCGEQVLTALDVAGLESVVDLPLAMQPQNLCFNSDGGQLFVTGNGMDGVAIAFTYLPLEIEQTVLAGRDPGAMACSTNPAYLFVASASGSDVCILDIDTRKVIGMVEVGQRPSFIAVTPDSQYALVLNENSGDMAVIRVASIQAKAGNAEKKRGKAGAALFTMLPVGAQPVQAVIVPKSV